MVPAISAVATPIAATTASVIGACAEEHGVAPDHVDAGRNHRRRVDQRRNRRRPFHRVGQPDVQRNLRRLAGRADEQQQGRNRQRADRAVLDRAGAGAGGDLLEIKRAEGREDQQHARARTRSRRCG